jgi:hypothetical protein
MHNTNWWALCGYVPPAEQVILALRMFTKLDLYDLRFSRRWLWRMASSGMLRCVALVRTDVSGELSASFIGVTRIGELGTTLAVTSNWRTLRRNSRLLVTASIVPSSPILVTLMKEALSSSETSSVLTRATQCNIPEDTILETRFIFWCFFSVFSDLVVWSQNKRLVACVLLPIDSQLQVTFNITVLLASYKMGAAHYRNKGRHN